MRVLHIVEASNTGVGRHVVDLAAGLLGHDCRVDLVYSTRRMDDVFAERLRSLPELHATAIDMQRRPAIADATVVRRVRALARQRGPFDIVHGHSSKGGAIARLAAGGRGPAVVYTPNGVFTMNPELSSLARRAVGAIERRLARRTDAVIAVSPVERDHLRDLGVADRLLHVIPNGIPARAWEPRETARRNFGIGPDEIVVGFLGRLSPQKNPELLVDAFARLASRCPEATLAVVGDGPRADACRDLVGAAKLDGRVRWLGFQTAEAAMPAFDVFAMPSRYEGMPYVLMEALCLGLPIVATDVGGTRLAVVDGENGRVVAPGDPAALADALASVLLDPAHRQQLGAASRKLSERFTVAEMVRRTLALYRELRPAPDEARPSDP
ncbi:MAG: glycosyltransferase family 4 protein [Planctomycetes bacterium]|nr:glycosyltransferase family 4 protein [Planctomycetota bacterium]